MPWEVKLQRPDGAPLGNLATVRHLVAAALPGVQFQRGPSGPERIAAARAAGVEFPDIIRQNLEQYQATEKAEFEGEGFSFVLYGFEAQPLTTIHAEVRGDGNPVAALAALCAPHGWLAVDAASGQHVDLGGAAIACWEAFRAYRDRAIRSIHAAEGAEHP
jgi:hypothetical protein